MPTSLPPGPEDQKRVRDFGLGPYDRTDEPCSEEDPSYVGESLPGGASLNPMPEDILGYPSSSAAPDVRSGSSPLPGDIDRPIRGHRPAEDIVESRVPSTSNSHLPSDKDNASARADYYDRMTVGDSELPGAPTNEVSLDDFLGALGNAWSGFVVEDMSNPAGFPSRNFREDPDPSYNGSLPEGFITSSNRRTPMISRQATNTKLVGTLTDDFLKKFGKKDLTRRHVMAFLKSNGYHQYLASDIVRCLKLRHDIHVADVLDQFPVKKPESKTKKKASLQSLVDVHDKLVRMSSVHPASGELRKISAAVGSVLIDLERLGNGKED